MLFLFDLKLRGTRPLVVHFHYIFSSTSVDLHYLCFLQLVNHVYFSPDGQWVASASFDKSVKLWNGITGTFVAAFRGHVGPVYQIRLALFFLRHLFLSHFWKDNSHILQLLCRSWSADSRLLLSGSKDSTLKVIFRVVFFFWCVS